MRTAETLERPFRRVAEGQKRRKEGTEATECLTGEGRDEGAELNVPEIMIIIRRFPLRKRFPRLTIHSRRIK